MTTKRSLDPPFGIESQQKAKKLMETIRGSGVLADENSLFNIVLGETLKYDAAHILCIRNYF